jgi:hypothetical protein
MAKPSKYALFVKDYFKKHPVKKGQGKKTQAAARQTMKDAAKAWKKQK